MSDNSGATTAQPGMGWKIGVWVATLIVAGMFCMAGIMKLTSPISVLAAQMPWAGDYSESFVRGIGLIDLAGGLGILLPQLTRIMPKLTVWAALGCSALQVCATFFHISRGEIGVVPLNLVLLASALVVFWARSKKIVVQPR